MQELETTLLVNDVEQVVRIEFCYTPETPASIDEPATEESFEITRLCALDADENKNQLVLEFPQWLFEIVYDDAIEAIKSSV